MKTTIIKSVKWLMLLFAVLTTATAWAQAKTESTLVSGIEEFVGGIGCVYVSGWVYDSDPVTKWWQAGDEIEIYGVVTTTRYETDENYEPMRSDDVEYFQRDDINEAYGLNGKHGFRITFDITNHYVAWFPEDDGTSDGKTFWVNVYAIVNNGNGEEEILLGDPFEVPNIKSPFWQETHVTQIIEGNQYGNQYTGFTTSDSWRNLVDGDQSTYISNYIAIIDFESDEVIIPVGIWFYTMGKDLNPASWTLWAKLHKEDEWTKLTSRDWPSEGFYNFSIVPFEIPNESYRGYRYFSLGARPRENDNYRYYLKEILLTGYCYKHLLPRLATCSQVGILRECYQRDSDGKYFADDAATIEYDASFVEIPKKNHHGESYNNTGCWRCWMCGNYFSDENCTTPQPTWSVTLPEQMELINDALCDADPNGKYVHGTVIEFKAKELYKDHISNVKVGETGLTPDQNGIYTLTMGDADAVVTAKVDLLVLADDADNADAISAFSRQHSGQQALVRLKDRTLYKDGLWNTLCLPFNMTEEQVENQLEHPTRLMTLKSASFQDGRLTLNFADTTGIQAGKPYIIRWTKASGYNEADSNTRDLKNPIFSDITFPEYNDSTMNIAQVYSDARCQNDYVDFIGTYAPLKFTSADKSILILSTVVWGSWSTTILSYPLENAVIGNGRGYFLLKGIHAQEASQIKEFVLNTEEDDATSIEHSTFNIEHSKESIYDLSGRKVNGQRSMANGQLPKGVYIVNGKKILK